MKDTLITLLNEILLCLWSAAVAPPLALIHYRRTKQRLQLCIPRQCHAGLRHTDNYDLRVTASDRKKLSELILFLWMVLCLIPTMSDLVLRKSCWINYGADITYTHRMNPSWGVWSHLSKVQQTELPLLPHTHTHPNRPLSHNRDLLMPFTL